MGGLDLGLVRSGAEPQATPAAAPAVPRDGAERLAASGNRTRRRVLRPFGGPEGKVYRVGEVVDVTAWRHTTRLIDQHKLSTETV